MIRHVEGATSLEKGALGLLPALGPRTRHGHAKVLPRRRMQVGRLPDLALALARDGPSVDLTIGIASRNPLYVTQLAEANLAGLVAFQADAV